MNLNDFRYMWCGQALRVLSNDNAQLLAPIDQRSTKHQRALLLLHGFSSSPAVYRLLLPNLTQYDAIVCPVLPGHAQSITDFGKATANDWLAAAEQACKALCDTYQQVDVLGLSLGGVLACYIAQRFTLHHLYLLAPATALHLNIPLADWTARFFYALGFRSLRNRAGNLHTHLHAELTYRQLPLAIIIELFSLIRHVPTLPSTCPVDLFLGRHDAVVDSVAVAKQFASLSNTTIHWLDHSAHVLPLDGDIETILAVINQHHRL